MNSNGDKLYTKFVALDEFKLFSFKIILWLKNWYIVHIYPLSRRYLPSWPSPRGSPCFSQPSLSGGRGGERRRGPFFCRLRRRQWPPCWGLAAWALSREWRSEILSWVRRMDMGGFALPATASTEGGEGGGGEAPSADDQEPGSRWKPGGILHLFTYES
jgi:hypothetical protein